MHSPGLPGAVGLPSCAQRFCAPAGSVFWLEKGPRRLSVGDTSWLARGTTEFWRFVSGCCGAPLPRLSNPPSPCSSFLPIFAQLRPAKDISKSLSGGPCD